MCFFNNTLHCSVKICLFFFFNFCYPSSQTHWISRDVHRLQIKECYHIDAGSLLAKMTMCSSSIWSPPLAPNFRVKSEILSMTHRPYYNPSRLSFSCFPALYLKLRRYWIANSSLNEQCCLASGHFQAVGTCQGKLCLSLCHSAWQTLHHPLGFRLISVPDWASSAPSMGFHWPHSPCYILLTRQ